MITIIVNGNAETADERVTVAAYCFSRKIDPAQTVVEINGSIVKKETFGNTFLHDGDAVEILRFIGGG